jgi:hypothetical protein
MYFIITFCDGCFYVLYVNENKQREIMDIVPLPWCIRDYSMMERNMDRIPLSNPVIIEEKDEWHLHFTKFINVIGIGYNSQTYSSSSGYFNFTKSGCIDNNEIQQMIILSISFILNSNGSIHGYEWGLSIQQHLKYLRNVNNSSISIFNKLITDPKELREHFKQIINISQMMSSKDEDDKRLAKGILLNYLKQ